MLVGFSVHANYGFYCFALPLFLGRMERSMRTISDLDGVKLM
jgi:hypothetical protein